MSAATTEQDWLLDAKAGSVREFYSELGVLLRACAGVEAPARCFANPDGHSHSDKTASCSVNLITGLWHCKGCGQAGNPYQAALAVGRSEDRAREMARSHGLFLEVAPKEKPRLPTERRLQIWHESLMASPRILGRLTEVKGWASRGIVACGLGWDGERVTFPIRNRESKCVGLVRYLPGGKPKTLAVPGSKRELFPPPEVTSRRRPLFVVEGEPDAVAVWSCGHQAVAVPGAGSWRFDWAGRFANRNPIVLADCDSQGRDLARRIVSVVPGARMVDVDPGRSDGHDIGDWVLGASREGGLRQMHDLFSSLAAG